MVSIVKLNGNKDRLPVWSTWFVTRGRGFESHQSPFRHGGCSSAVEHVKPLTNTSSVLFLETHSTASSEYMVPQVRLLSGPFGDTWAGSSGHHFVECF